MADPKSWAERIRAAGAECTLRDALAAIGEQEETIQQLHGELAEAKTARNCLAHTLADEQRAHAETKSTLKNALANCLHVQRERDQARAELDRARPVLEACAALTRGNLTWLKHQCPTTAPGHLARCELARRAAEKEQKP